MKKEFTKQLLSLFIVTLLGIFAIGSADTDELEDALNEIETEMEEETKTNKAGGEFSGYIEVTNNTGYDVYYLYVSHEDSEDWEDDVLGDEILEDGESFRVELDNYPSSIFDVQAEDEDEDTYTLYGIDVETDDLNLTIDDLD